MDPILEEESLLIDKLLSARHATELAKNEAKELKLKINQLEKYEEGCHQAVIDYMVANGLKQFIANGSLCTLGDSMAMEVPDATAVPTEYMRIKVTKEPNKALIAELYKSGALEGANWFSAVKSHKITITYKG